MKTILDFTRVPLDKWVDLYRAVNINSYVYESLADITKIATTQVKEASDYDKEVAEACVAYFTSNYGTPEYARLFDVMEKRSEALKAETKEPATQPVQEDKLAEIPF